MAAPPSFSEIRESLDRKLFKERERPPSPPPPPLKEEVVSEGVTINSGTVIQEDTCNLIVVSSSDNSRAKVNNTSTITIISDLPDPSNSLASNISQVRRENTLFINIIHIFVQEKVQCSVTIFTV